MREGNQSHGGIMIVSRNEVSSFEDANLSIEPDQPQRGSVDKSVEEEVPNLTCEICVEPMTEIKKFNNKNSCAHPFCLDCIAKNIEAKIGENSTAKVPCPASNCDKLLDPISCRPILPAGLFERWCDVLCESAVLKGESVYCYCPSATCSALVLNECGGNITRSECPNCKKLFCFQCKIPWHVGFGCNETEQLRDENDFLFGEHVERNNWKRCPGCNFLVEKLDGCSNIKCRFFFFASSASFASPFYFVVFIIAHRQFVSSTAA
ncbi:E3 ubiquitin-protein ligase RNF144A-like [Telopea speciosissima]|uniref:E3 ubiquitin-protein ligase RNF144A-like n=1 Tax=Telopea speciosissima TaxID=54955 RepID=UPI001CC4DBBE|nr:E3 ubiquitin-protein ligase RNF144A-like [Telopea speciosissima]